MHPCIVLKEGISAGEKRVGGSSIFCSCDLGVRFVACLVEAQSLGLGRWWWCRHLCGRYGDGISDTCATRRSGNQFSMRQINKLELL